jgi:hypothetical protein
MNQERNGIKFCANFGKNAAETMAVIRQAFEEESLSHIPKVQTHRDQKEKVRQVKSKVESMLIISFGMKGIIHKGFVPTSQTVNFAYYCDILRRLRENVRILRPELWRQRTGCCSMITHHLTLPFH